MSNRFFRKIGDKLVRHGKYFFPAVVIMVVALTVLVSLNAIRAKAEAEEMLAKNNSASDIPATPESMAANVEPMAVSEEPEVRALIEAYVTAEGVGDVASISAICDELPLLEAIKIEEIAKFKTSNTLLEVYTKKGFREGTYVAFAYYTSTFSKFDSVEVPGYQYFYLDRNEDGALYIKLNSDNFSAEENEYIQSVIQQVDVIELNNRVNVEYAEVGEANPELFDYIEALRGHVNEEVGVRYAAMMVPTEPDEPGEPDEPEVTPTTVDVDEPEEEEPQYAKALETVNVRNSDSIQADRLGQVSAGERVLVQEVRVNGWTRILYEGKDGFIKSEFLQLEENANKMEVIGKVTAIDDVNVRAGAAPSAMKIGGLANGSSLDLLGEENGWCKVNYNGTVGYVKTEYTKVEYTSNH